MRRFSIDAAEFEHRHTEMAGPLESGEITFDEYLDVTIFDEPRDFTREEITAFILTQSAPDEAAIAIARGLSSTGRYWLMTMNNESDFLNRHRIHAFGLDQIFDAFLSSCWLGLRKPSRRFYDRALQIAQADPRESLFIDDREHNLAAARRLGLHVIHFTSAPQLGEELRSMNITYGTGAR